MISAVNGRTILVLDVKKRAVDGNQSI